MKYLVILCLFLTACESEEEYFYKQLRVKFTPHVSEYVPKVLEMYKQDLKTCSKSGGWGHFEDCAKHFLYLAPKTYVVYHMHHVSLPNYENQVPCDCIEESPWSLKTKGFATLKCLEAGWQPTKKGRTNENK